jgi:filamentous hemagglutinin family protein
MRSYVFPVIFGLVFFSQPGLLAQTPIHPDASLSTQVTTTDGLNFTIDAGGRAGRNLFHSFEAFSIPTGGSASFNNTIDVQNIFSRITGSSPSQIDGVLRANGNANVFLLNPHGLWFGRNAQLAIGGSFLGTTASRLQFSDGIEFSTIAPTALLSISIPIGLQMGQNAGQITLVGHGHRLQSPNAILTPISAPTSHPGLAVAPGQTIGLVANGLNLNGGIIAAPSGRLELGSVAHGSVQLTSMPQGFSVSYAGVDRFNDIHLSQRSLLDPNLFTPGSVQLQGRNISIQSGSIIWSQNRSDHTFGNIQLSASEQVRITGFSEDFQIPSGIIAESLGAGVSSPVAVNATQITLEAGGAIATRNFRDSLGSGNITLKTKDLSVQNYVPQVPDLYSRIATVTLGQGRAGNLSVNADNIAVLNGGYIGSTSIGSGRGGDVAIQAKQVDVNGFTPNLTSSIIAASTIGLGGDAGNLEIQTDRINVSNHGLITTSSIGVGSAGNITINAKESIIINGAAQPGLYESSITSTVVYPTPIYQQTFGLSGSPQGSSGNLQVVTPRLSIIEGAALGSYNFANGMGGSVKIWANELDLRSARINASAFNGDGGNLKLYVDNLKLRQGSQIAAAAGNAGNGGNIEITAPIILGLENSDIIANAAQGRGGSIMITTEGIIGLKYRSQLTLNSDINASSEFGINGTVAIKNLGVEPDSGRLLLPTDTINPNQKMMARCDISENNRFVISGRGGMPSASLSIGILSPQIWHDVRSPFPQSTTPIAESAQSALTLQEATNWQRNTQGQVELQAPQAVTSQEMAQNC